MTTQQIATGPETDTLTASEAAARLNVSGRTMRQWLLDGRLVGAEKVGRAWRVPRQAVDGLARRTDIDAMRRDDGEIDYERWRTEIYQARDAVALQRLATAVDADSRAALRRIERERLEGRLIDEEYVQEMVDMIYAAIDHMLGESLAARLAQWSVPRAEITRLHSGLRSAATAAVEALNDHIHTGP